MYHRASAAAFVVVTALAWSSDGRACPACVDPAAANTNAFLGSTVALSLIPLLFIFLVVSWVIKQERAAQRAAAAFAADEAARTATVAVDVVH